MAPTFAVSIPAMTIWVKVDSNIMKDQTRKEHQPAALRYCVRGDCVSIHANKVIKREENGHVGQRVPRQLHKDVGQHEDIPRVRPRGTLSGFILIALDDEVRHRLVDQERKNDSKA